MRGTAILVAEDDANDRLLLEKAFKQAEVPGPIRFVSDGADAIELLQQSEANSAPKILIIDLKMPRIDGFQLMDWVGRQRRLDRMRVIVLTSSEAPSDRTHAVDLGADEYYIKPQNFNDLKRLAMSLKLYLDTHEALARSA